MQYMDLREKLPHGSFGYPVALYMVDCHHPRYYMDCHWHVECEFIRVRAGELSYMVGGEAGHAGPGELLFANSGTLHAGTPRAGVYDCLLFDPAMLIKQEDVCGGILQDFADGNLQVQLRLPLTGNAALAELVSALYAAAAEPSSWGKFAVQGLLLQFYGLVLRQGWYHTAPPATGRSKTQTGRLKEVLRLIEAEYTSPLSLEELAGAAGMSPKYFCRVFHKMTGRTPIDYLNHYRVEAACLHIASGMHSATELAYECGFNDLSYFIRVFKRYKGLTPKSYIRQAGQAGA